VASPVGHALVGLSAAAVVQQITGIESTPTLWIGAFIASGVPDLDVFLRFVGKDGPRYHRNASHSFLTLVAFWIAVVGISFGLDLGLSWGLLFAWLAALLTHPMLDYLTTGTQLGKVGYGIGLWWPVSQTRYFSKRVWLARDRGETRRPWDYVPQALEELIRLGPLAAGAAMLAYFLA
jgi:membrane-bound metal-dependent hydrolase YbcI (DUF457 family)